MSQIDRLKKADSEGNLADVMKALGALLDEDFLGYVGKATKEFKKCLQGGVFSQKYQHAFWESDLPFRFGAQWAGHPLHAYAFWRSLLAQQNYLALISTLLKERPEAVALGLRRHRIFLYDDKWKPVRELLLERNQMRFVEGIEALRCSLFESNKTLGQFDNLIEKVSSETLVLHFSIWLEKVYFAFEDERDFRMRTPDFVEILERILKHKASLRHHGIESKKKAELESLQLKVFKKLKADPRSLLETEPLFRAMHEHLNLEHTIELFCSFDWNLERSPSGITALPASDAQKSAWLRAPRKSHAKDMFETWCPLSSSDRSHSKFLASVMPNQLSADTQGRIETAQRFLAKHLGREAYDTSAPKLGFELKDALTLLLCNHACYEYQFVAPREEAKKQNRTYIDSLGLNPHYEDLIATEKGLATLLTRSPFEARDPSQFIEVASSFTATKDIPSSQVRIIYDTFSQDTHGAEMNLSNKLLLRNKYCDILLPRIFAGDIKSILFNHLFEKKEFTRLISGQLEGRLQDIFRHRKFKTIMGRKLGSRAEIDLLAYRDKTLFLIEAKCTRVRTRASEVRQVKDRLEEAAAQLRRLREELTEFWNELYREVDAPEDLSDLRIILIIASNSLEFDHDYFDDIIKISDFELEMVFANNAFANALMNSYHETQFEAEDYQKRVQEIKTWFGNLHTQDLERFALYPANTEPTVAELVACLEESRFWSKVFGHPIELTPLGKF
jgi:hypothetical protein